MSIIGSTSLSLVFDIYRVGFELEIVLSLVLVVLPTLSLSHLFMFTRTTTYRVNVTKSLLKFRFSSSATLLKVLPANVIFPILFVLTSGSPRHFVMISSSSPLRSVDRTQFRDVSRHRGDFCSTTSNMVHRIVSWLNIIVLVSVHDKLNDLEHLNWMDAVLVLICPILRYSVTN